MVDTVKLHRNVSTGRLGMNTATGRLTATHFMDIYVATGSGYIRKYEYKGTTPKTWEYHIGTQGHKVVLDADENVYVAGQKSAGGKNIWKLNSSGSLQWDTAQGNWLTSCAVDKDGYLIVVGSAVGDTENYVWKINQSQVLQWSYHLDNGGPWTGGYVRDVCVDNNNNVYVCGSYDDDNKCVWKLDSGGNLKWRYGYSSYSSAYSVAIYHNKYLYISFHSGGAKLLTSTGQVVHKRSLPSTYIDYYSIAIDVNGNMYRCDLYYVKKYSPSLVYIKTFNRSAIKHNCMDLVSNLVHGFASGIHVVDQSDTLLWSVEENINAVAVRQLYDY